MISGGQDNHSGSARPWIGLVLGAAALYLVLALQAAAVETPTIDEFAHVPAGCAYWRHGQFALYAKNPPLHKMLMALPVLASGAETPRAELEPMNWAPWIYGYRFMSENFDRYLTLFFRARIVSVLAGLLTALVLFCWARQLCGTRAAAIAAALFLLDPNVLAHSHLGTVDAASMFSITAALVALQWAYRSPTPKRFMLAGFVWGLALLVKFTAVLLLPSTLAIVAFERRTDARLALRDIALLLLCAAATINVGMGLQGSFTPIGQYKFESELMQTTQALLPAWLPTPLPSAYCVGFDAQALDAQGGEFGSYLFGQWSDEGWWYYNLVALTVKTPLPVLMLVLAAPWSMRRLPDAWRKWRVAILSGASLLLMMMFFNRLNIGVRYLLPLLPLGYLAAASHWRLPARWKNWLAGLLVAVQAFTMISIHPSYLAYFNLAVGGSANGHRVLLDSNLDWGQDLYRVPQLLGNLGYEGPIELLYFGHADPALYGIDYRLLPARPVPGVIAVSTQYLLGGSYLATDVDGRVVEISSDHCAWLRQQRPVARAGSIWVFDTRPRLTGEPVSRQFEQQ
jgi:hypothetical protein